MFASALAASTAFIDACAPLAHGAITDVPPEILQTEHDRLSTTFLSNQSTRDDVTATLEALKTNTTFSAEMKDGLRSVLMKAGTASHSDSNKLTKRVIKVTSNQIHEYPENYGTEHLWKIITDQNLSIEVIVNALTDHMMMIGLCWPKEAPTQKVWINFALHARGTPYSAAEAKNAIDVMRSSLHQKRKQPPITAPLTIKEYPQDVNTFTAAHPRAYTSPPVPTKIERCHFISGSAHVLNRSDVPLSYLK